MRGAKVYLTYTLAGGGVLLFGVAWLSAIAGPVEFIEGGALDAIADAHRTELTLIFVLLIAGLGVKAALLPLHGWLPQAMVAPAPVSALLHAVAVVKAGAFGIVRVVYDVYGVDFAAELGVLPPLAVLAAATIVYGSFRALSQDGLKKRLAYSTVSQVSYIALGTAIFGPVASIGGIVHLVHQGVMKITLFFCAGNLAETLGIHNVSEMRGCGRRMPLTMAAFTVGALGMIGVPPVAGFVTKWYLGTGAVAAGSDWVLLVLAASSLLNAAYFLPILYTAWFQAPAGPWPDEQPRGRFEAPLMLLVPAVVTAVLSLAAGLLAAAPFSPLEWAKLIAAREYGL
jgi:multicomponent Na+:H+ antiporter subunit D